MTKRLLTAGALLGAAAGTWWLLRKSRRALLPTSLPSAAPVRAAHTIRIQAPAGRVFQLLSNISQWASWQPAITEARLVGPPAKGSAFDWRLHGVRIHSTLLVCEPDHVFSWVGQALGIAAVHVWNFTQQAGYTEVTSEETRQGWPASLLKPLLQAALDQGHTQWLHCLRQAAETSTSGA